MFGGKFVSGFGAVEELGVVSQVSEEDGSVAKVGFDLREVIEHIHRDKGFVVFGKNVGELVHGRRIIRAHTQRFAVGGGTFFVLFVQAVNITQVNQEVDFFGVGGIAFANHGNSAFKIVERDVRFGKLVHNANVFFV